MFISSTGDLLSRVDDDCPPIRPILDKFRMRRGRDMIVPNSDDHGGDMRINQIPVASFARAMRIAYIMPFHTTDPRNICLIGMEKPMEACTGQKVSFLSGNWKPASLLRRKTVAESVAEVLRRIARIFSYRWETLQSLWRRRRRRVWLLAS